MCFKRSSPWVVLLFSKFLVFADIVDTWNWASPSLIVLPIPKRAIATEVNDDGHMILCRYRHDLFVYDLWTSLKRFHFKYRQSYSRHKIMLFLFVIIYVLQPLLPYFSFDLIEISSDCVRTSSNGNWVC